MTLAILVGSGALPSATHGVTLELPALRFGVPSAPAVRVRLAGVEALVLVRHGTGHAVPPHLINYRANLELLHVLGASRIVALNTVGGIAPEAWTGRLVVPDQLVDYTWGREHTFVTVGDVRHADFAEPFDGELRRRLLDAARRVDIDADDGGVYGCTQGPRFETAAEIEMMARAGCTLVGMTGMPEAALARELGIPYAMLSLVVNPAAGRAADPFDLARIRAVLESGMRDVDRLLQTFAAAGG